MSWATARLVFNDLRQHDFDVFMDVQSIDSGDFETVILTQIAARAHFVLLLEPGSLDGIDSGNDWFRREIAHALACRRNIVPVTASGFTFTPGVVLPADVRDLVSLNAVSVPPDYFDEAMQKLRRRFLRATSLPPLTPAPAAAARQARSSAAAIGRSEPVSSPLDATPPSLSVRWDRSQVVVTWAAVPSADSYVLERMTGTDAATATVVYRGRARDFRQRAPVSPVSFRVKATGRSLGEAGAWSSTVTATPDDALQGAMHDHQQRAGVLLDDAGHRREPRPLRDWGWVLIGVALVALLAGWISLEGPGSTGRESTANDPTSSTKIAAGPDTSASSITSSPSTSTTPEPRSPVRVYNNSTIGGLAAQAADDFRRNGWVVEAIDIYSAGVMPTSTVYYLPGTAEEAAARTLGARFKLRIEPRFEGIAAARPGLIVIVTEDYGSGR